MSLPISGGRLGLCRSVFSICSASALVRPVPTPLDRCVRRVALSQVWSSDGLLPQTTRVRSELFGSLGATGHGHGSYNAVLWGLEGEDPETVDTTNGPLRANEIKTNRTAAAQRHARSLLRR